MSSDLIINGGLKFNTEELESGDYLEIVNTTNNRETVIKIVEVIPERIIGQYTNMSKWGEISCTHCVQYFPEEFTTDGELTLKCINNPQKPIMRATEPQFNTDLLSRGNHIRIVGEDKDTVIRIDGVYSKKLQGYSIKFVPGKPQINKHRLTPGMVVEHGWDLELI